MLPVPFTCAFVIPFLGISSAPTSHVLLGFHHITELYRQSWGLYCIQCLSYALLLTDKYFVEVPQFSNKLFNQQRPRRDWGAVIKEVRHHRSLLVFGGLFAAPIPPGPMGSLILCISQKWKHSPMRYKLQGNLGIWYNDSDFQGSRKESKCALKVLLFFTVLKNTHTFSRHRNNFSCLQRQCLQL